MLNYSGFNPAACTIFSVFRVDRGLTDAGAMQAGSGGACHVLSGPSDYLLYFGMMPDVLCTTVGASSAWNALAGSSPNVVGNRNDAIQRGHKNHDGLPQRRRHDGQRAGRSTTK
jgi:hypothetical protein